MKKHALGPTRIPQLERIPHWERKPDWERIPGDYRIRGTQTYTTQCCVYHGKKSGIKKTNFEVFFSLIFFFRCFGPKYDGPGIWGKWSCHLNPVKNTHTIVFRDFSLYEPCKGPKIKTKKKNANTLKWCESGMCSLLRVWRMYNLAFQYTLGARHVYQQLIAFQNP